MTAERYVLIDLGGTQTRIGLGDAAGLDKSTVRAFQNAEFPDLSGVLAVYLNDTQGPIAGVCAGVAGPVQNDTAQLTNLNWFVDGLALKKMTGADFVFLINDLQAQGYALDDVPSDAITHLRGTPTDGTRLILNIGTGCNGAVIHRSETGLFVPAAEAGHSALAHPDRDLFPFFDNVRQHQRHLPIEAILSGPGLTRTHAWVSGEVLTPKAVMSEIQRGTEDGRQTLSIFLRILGSVTGDFALHHLPHGGIYFSGGLSEAMAPHINHPDFWDTFHNRGPYTDIVRAMPIGIIHEDGFALRGCLRYVLQHRQ